MVGTLVRPALSASNVDLFYGNNQVLKSVNFEAPEREVTALIGPSGCGKSSFLRCFNRMNDRISGARVSGNITVAGQNPYDPKIDLMALRRDVGMLFQKPNPFPMTIFENVALAPRLHYGLKGSQLEGLVESCLKKAALWDEVKDDMRRKNGLELSGGQQQRLCLARMLAVQPKVILMDEPCSALDPISSEKIEDLILELGQETTILIVTHNLQQAHRVSKHCAFFMLGVLIERGETEKMFSDPQNPLTADYITGRFG
ncbi:MAG TPA: phosphate ABC transporter ATP-binding protein PstB [Fimbriimonadaceae bacterium]|nr:phosphate ABC transporter ATP-binding protein PstB [Fimbriimonadaceae bacterium]